MFLNFLDIPMIRFKKTIQSLFLLFLIGYVGLAQARSEYKSEDENYTVYYNVFNSTFLQPDIAELYNLKRAPNLALINIAVHYKGKPIQANIEGTATNLLGQETKLAFQKIKEGKYYYYLAPIKFTNEDHFKFNTKVTNDKDHFSFTFNKKLYEG